MTEHIVKNERTAEFQKDGVLRVRTTSSRIDPDHRIKFWDVDPQQQIIDLLKEQLVLLKKIADSTVPYHTGSQAVTLLPVTQPGSQKGPISPVDEPEPSEGS